MQIDDDLEPFEGPELLIEESLVAINNAEVDIKDALTKHTYDVIDRVDNGAKMKVRIFRYHKKMPPNLRNKVSHIINDLRHSLDQALCDSALVTGAGNISHIQFPFCGSAGDLNSRIKAAMKGMHPAIISIAKNVKPYPGGNDFLHAVNSLTAANKHRRIINIAPVTNGWVLDASQPLQISGHVGFMGVGKISILKNEIEVARYGLDTEFTTEIKVPLDVCVGDSPVIGGQPIIPILRRFLEEVRLIVANIKTETFKIVGK